MFNLIVYSCRAVELTKKLKADPNCGPKIKDFKSFVDENVPQELVDLKNEVELFAAQFPTIGFEKSSMRYKDAGNN